MPRTSAWTMIVAADAVEVRIHSVYPPVNGKNDLPYQPLNTVFYPSNTCPIGSAHVMWTNTRMHTKGTWTPNHFVIMKPNPENNDQQFRPTVHSSPTSTSTTDTSNPSIAESPIQSPVPSKNSSNSSLRLFSISSSPSVHVILSALGSPVSNSTPQHTFTSHIQEDSVSAEQPEECAEGKFIQHGKWLSTLEIFGEISNDETSYSEVPSGPRPTNTSKLTTPSMQAVISTIRNQLFMMIVEHGIQLKEQQQKPDTS